MAGESGVDHHAELRRHLEELTGAERELDAQIESALSRLDAAAAEGVSEAEAEAVRAELDAAAASTRAHFQGLRADLERRLGREPPKGRREELQQALEDLELTAQRLEAGAERRRAELASLATGHGPLQEDEAGFAQMTSDLDAGMAQARAQFAAMRAEIERELKDGPPPPE